MAKFICTGLYGSHPLGALAAMGALRVASRLPLPQPVRLSWVVQPDWVARLHIPGAVSKDAVVQAFVADVAERATAPELTWRPDLYATPEVYHQFAAAQMARATPLYRSTVDFLAAYGSELITQKTMIAPTALDMTSGHQKFLALVAAIAQDLRRNAQRTSEAIAEALWGPWRYRDRVHALGWDPDGERLHAYEAQSPTKTKAVSVMAAIWLAFEALPLFPTAAVAGHLAVGGFDRAQQWLSWPLWDAPLALPTVRSLLSLADLTLPHPPTERLQAMGIGCVYRSWRAQRQYGYGLLRPAVRVV
jgi:hypothetical protein